MILKSDDSNPDEDLNIQEKLNYLMSISNNQKKKKIKQSTSTIQASPMLSNKNFSYSRTLRHFYEIKTKIGEVALNSKVLSIFQRTLDTSFLNYPDSGQLHYSREQALRPSTQVSMGSPFTLEQYSKHKVSENTQTEDLQIKKTLRPLSEQIKRHATITRQNVYVQKMKKQPLSQKISNNHSQDSKSSNRTLYLELCQLYAKPRYIIQDKKQKQHQSINVKKSSEQYSQHLSQFDFHTLNQSDKLLLGERKNAFKFTQYHYKKQNKITYQPILLNSDYTL